LFQNIVHITFQFLFALDQILCYILYLPVCILSSVATHVAFQRFRSDKEHPHKCCSNSILMSLNYGDENTIFDKTFFFKSVILQHE